MKKCILAAVLLAALIALSVWNIRYLDAFTGELNAGVELARRQWRDDNFPAAAETLRGTIDLWRSRDGYTHILIRHSEIDATSDVFYELLASVLEEDAAEAEAHSEMLFYHLSSILEMERVTLKSVF